MQEKVLYSFKSKLFSIKNLDKIPTQELTPEPAAEPSAKPTPKPATEATPTKYKKSKLKLLQEFLSEIIADEKDTNNEIFSNYFKYPNPSCLVKDLIIAKQNEKLVNNINNGLIDLRNSIIRKEIPKNENPKKIADIVEKILKFKK